MRVALWLGRPAEEDDGTGGRAPRSVRIDKPRALSFLLTTAELSEGGDGAREPSVESKVSDLRIPSGGGGGRWWWPGRSPPASPPGVEAALEAREWERVVRVEASEVSSTSEGFRRA